MSLPLLQLPKTKQFFRGLAADQGHTLVYADACLHPEVELLTESGWVPSGEYKTGRVWQVDKDTLQGSWAEPLRYINKNYIGTIHEYGNNRGSLRVTHDHTMLWVGQVHKDRKDKEKLRWVTKAEDGIPSSGCNFATATYNSSVSNYSTKEIWMACMLQADGSISNDGRYKNLKYRISVNKPRKILKIKELVGREPKLTSTRAGQTMPTATWHSIEFSSDLLNIKTLDLTKLGANQAKDLFEALAFWDGRIDKSGTLTYSSTIKENVEQLSRFFPRCGYECRQSTPTKKSEAHRILYSVRVRPKNRIRVRKLTDLNTYDYTGTVCCVTVPSGFILVRDRGQTFVTGNCALEPHVCAFYSRDPGLLSLYQTGRPTNDIYIYVGAGSEQYGPLFKGEGYDPLSPTKESIKAIKTKYSEQRQICKKISLGCNYGMGKGKLHRELNIAGFDISFEEAGSLWDSYWRSFKGIKVFERELKRQWADNGGWIRGIRGEPITIPKPYKYFNKETGKYETIDYTKDIVNRFVQRGGHNIHMRFIYHINSLRLDRCPSMVPFHVDLHDSTTWQVPEDLVDVAKGIFREACARLNDELKWDVRIIYEPKTGTTMESFLED